MKLFATAILLSLISLANADNLSNPELVIIGNVISGGTNPKSSSQTVEIIEVIEDTHSWNPPKTIQVFGCAICEKIPAGKAKIWLYVHSESGGKSWQLSKYEILQ